MPLFVNNSNLTGSSGHDIVAPGTQGGLQIASGGEGDDFIFGNRLPFLTNIGNANQTWNTALSIDAAALWSAAANPLSGAVGVPTTTIYGQSTGGYHCYSVTLAVGATMTLDIDGAHNEGGGFDTFVEVLNASTGAVLATFDDSNREQGGFGSDSARDSFGQYMANSAGTYIIRVGRFYNGFASVPLEDGDIYALSVSIAGHAASGSSGSGISFLSGQAGNDYLVGYTGDDRLDGGTGADDLYGFTGTDYLTGGDGDDLLDGGDGYDTAVYLGAAGAVTVDLRIAEAQNTLGAGIDRLISIEDVRGSAHNDTLTGNDLANTLNGDEGNDTIMALGGADRIEVGFGSDTVDGGSGTDTLAFSNIGINWTIDAIAGTATAASTGATVTFTGIEIIEGYLGADIIYSDGSGEFYGGSGNDLIYAGLGTPEKLDGGFHIDTLDTTSWDDVYSINLATGVTNYVGESFVNFENLIFGDGANTALGTSGANVIRGGSHIDTLDGADGDDTLDGGAGTDMLIGGNGFDVASYERAGSAVSVSLATSAQQDTGGAGLDTLTTIEGLIGSAWNDTLTGDGLANRFEGRGGNDTVAGGDGDDVFVWAQGGGHDSFDGGDGNADILNLQGATSGWTVNLNSGAATNGLDGSVQLTGVEEVYGSNQADELIANDFGGSILRGLGGNDLIRIGNAFPNETWGGAGIDTLDTTAVAGTFSYGIDLSLGQTSFGEVIAEFENLVSGATRDLVTGTNADNRIETQAGDDSIEGGGGDDRIDGGDGNDTARYSLAAGAVTVRLDVAGPQATLGAGTDTLIGIENLTGSAHADDLTGNKFANRLDGGLGADTLRGGLGNDIYGVDNGGDAIVEAPGQGTDMVEAWVSYTLGANVEHLTLMGGADIDATGNALNNILTGNIGHNRLDGGAGNDTMRGGLGSDTYVVESGSDKAIELDGEGNDEVHAHISYTLAANIENLFLIGPAAVNGTGNALVNFIFGNSVNNRLDGVAGADYMEGAAGDDTYIVDDSGDVVFESAGEGSDTVQSKVSFILDADIEHLRLTGIVGITGIGNALDNSIYGNAANNRIDGGGGNDLMRGGGGNDTYVVDSAGDTIVELDGQGTDAVEASVSWTLGSYIENLTLTGVDAINGSGNGFANLITGNGVANVLSGGTGNDRLEGLGGNGRLDGGAGQDAMYGGAGDDVFVVDDDGDTVFETVGIGIDTIESRLGWTLGSHLENLTLIGTAVIDGTGNGLANILTGNAAANRLDGRAGADTMAGLGGNDIYIVDHAGDVVIENASQGIDLVESIVSFTLGANVENLTLTGSGGVGGTGNASANVIRGNSGMNALDGGGGNDSLYGGAGRDTLTGGLGNDGFYLDAPLAANSYDTITDFNVANDTIWLDRDIFTAILVDGALVAAAFRIGTAAADADDRIIYDPVFGRIWYDADGDGAGAAVEIARVTAGLALTRADFVGYN